MSAARQFEPAYRRPRRRDHGSGSWRALRIEFYGKQAGCRRDYEDAVDRRDGIRREMGRDDLENLPGHWIPDAYLTAIAARGEHGNADSPLIHREWPLRVRRAGEAGPPPPLGERRAQE